MTAQFTPRARDDLRHILDYIAQANPTAADRLRKAISDTVAAIVSQSHLGIRNAKARELRSLLVARYPYRIHYLKKTPISGYSYPTLGAASVAGSTSDRMSGLAGRRPTAPSPDS